MVNGKIKEKCIKRRTWCFFDEYFLIWWLCWPHLSNWNWNQDTAETQRYGSYLNLHLEIDSKGGLRTKLYDKIDNFQFPIFNFPFMYSNIPVAYGVYISHLIRYSRAWASYQDLMKDGCTYVSGSDPVPQKWKIYLFV